MKNAGDNERGMDRSWQLSAVVLQVERAFDDDDSVPDYEFRQGLEMLQSYASSEKTQQLAQALASEAGKELTKREKVATSELDELIAKHVKTATDASTAAELDTPLAELSKAQRSARYRGGSRRDGGLAERLQQATQFVSHWQDYLSAKEAGRTEQARSALSNLAGYSHDNSFIPRSKLLALINSLATEQATPRIPQEPIKASLKNFLADIKTLDDLVAAKESLKTNGFAGEGSSDIVPALRSLANSYELVKTGQATSLRLTWTESLASVETARLREQFLVLALPRMLQVDEAKEGFQQGETAVAYLTRHLTSARQKQDWALAKRVLSTSQSLSLLDNVTTIPDWTMLDRFLTGLNQEKAKQYSLAVSSFQAALKTASQIVPPELIGEHLEAIHTQHSDDFEKGMQLVLNPLPSGPTGASPYPSGFDPRRLPTLMVPAKPTPETEPKRRSKATFSPAG